MSFDTALAFVLAREGGFSNDPADPGGATNYGITQRTYDGWQDQQGLPREAVKNIHPSVVADIYRRDYWSAAHCEVLESHAALAVFDTAVNLGVGRAGAMWQASNRDVNDFLWRRVAHYVELVRLRPTMLKFLAGWVKRVLLLRAAP